MHERSLEMLGELFALERGADIFTRDGRTLSAKATGSISPAWCRPSGRSPTKARRASTEARSPKRSLQVDGVVLDAEESRVVPRRSGASPVIVDYQGRRVATRGGLSGVPELLPRLPRLGGLTPTERVLALVDVLETDGAVASTRRTWSPIDSHGRRLRPHRTRWGSGQASGSPTSTSQLNNLLGESDIVVRRAAAGDHLESRMAPVAGLRRETGSSSRSAPRARLACERRWRRSCRGVVDEELDAETAVGLPRVHPTVDVVDAEPGVDEAALATLEESGRTIRRWDRIHHYFGGVSCVGRAGAAGDPRRSGAAHVL